MTYIRVETPARLHLGMFDISGTLGRRFGGIGVTVDKPALILEARRSRDLTATGPDSDRALEFAARYLAAAELKEGVHLDIQQAIPHHSGLGSGTKLGLTVALALATLYDQPSDAFQLARLVERGERSAVGLWTFSDGGFVVEGGRKAGKDSPAPLLMRFPMPEHWRCVLAIPYGPTGLSGRAEIDAFARLEPTAAQAAEISHLVLMSLLPALVEQELNEFGTAVTRLQQLVGKCFNPVQQGYYTHEMSTRLIESMLEAGAAGAGQSSWGPTVYGFFDQPETGDMLLRIVRTILAGQGWAEIVTFENRGALVEYC